MKHSNNLHLKVKDHLITSEEFSLYWDDSKTMLITVPQPSEDELGKYYESQEYISHTDDSKGWFNKAYQWVKKRSLKKKLKLINSLNNEEKTLLDIGAGTASFLELAKSDGWKVEGVEPNNLARSLAADKGVNLVSEIDSVVYNKYSVITLWHVLEHLPNLEEVIQQIEDMLSPGGILIIAVPNFKSFDANHYKNSWAAYDAPRHLWHFSQEAMKQLFSNSLKLEKTAPLIFDSYYVSLLSEKIKNNRSNLVRAFLVGLRSNIAAGRSGEYSSLIYCYRKGK